MAFTVLSTNMNLPVPVVGQEPGPQYAIDINDCMGIIDGHDHSPGYGVKITPAGLNISTDLEFNNHNATMLRSVRFEIQSSPLALASDLGCLYESGVDLYYNDGAGNQIRITQSGGIAGTPGSIANLVSPASATYVSADSTFVWQSAANTPAKMDSASIILRNLVSGSFGAEVFPPAAMAADISYVLPSLPASNLPVSIDAAGNMSAAQLTVAQLAAAVQQALNPAGAIMAYGGAAAPSGYLLCDGASYLRTDYPSLFAAISIAYGAADINHFNVPDLRGQFLRGVTGASSNDPDAASRTAMATGGNTGNNVGSIQADAFRSHVHANSAFQNLGGANSNFMYNGANSNINVNTQATGGNETRPINAYVNFCIKT